MRAEFSNDSGCAALGQKSLLLPRQAGKEVFHMCSEARAALAYVKHSQVSQGVYPLCQHFHWARERWWLSAAGSASGEEDEGKQQLQQCLLFICDLSLQVVLLLLGCKQSKFCLLEGETLKV